MHDEIARAIAVIIRNNIVKIDNAYMSDGGYEGWMQVELAEALRNKQYAVQREVEYPYLSVNGSKQRCDIVFGGYPLELKVDTRNCCWRDAVCDDAYKVAGVLKRGERGYAVRISKNSVAMLQIPNPTKSTIKTWRVNGVKGKKDAMYKKSNRTKRVNPNGMELENEEKDLITDVTSLMSGGIYMKNGAYFITIIEVMG